MAPADAEASAASAPDAKLLHYRVSAEPSEIATRDHRAHALTELIRSVNGDHYVATST